MMHDMTYQEAIQKADAIKALNAMPVYLRGENPPWHLANSVEPGGSHRLDISTSVWVKGRHADTGLEFQWSFDIEARGANGKGSYEIDAAACREAMRKMPEAARAQFRIYLLDCAEKVAAKGLEYQQIANRQASDAAQLRDIAAA